MKIKQIFYITLLIFTLLPLYFFGSIMIHENNVNIENIVTEDLNAISGSQILDINNFCEARKTEMSRVAKYAIVKDTILASLGEKPYSSQSVEYTQNILNSIGNNNGSIESITIIDKNFQIVQSSNTHEKPPYSDLKDMESKYLTGDFIISNVYERETAEGTKKLVSSILGVKNEDELIGYIVEEIPSSYFDRYRSNTNLWKNGTFYLLDGNGALITAGVPGEESLSNFVTTEEDRENFQNAWNAVDHEKNPNGCINYTMGKNEYITYYSNIDYTDWGIRLSVNLSDYKKTSDLYKTLIVLMIICLTLVLIIVNYIVTQHLTKPVNKIANTLKQIQDEQNYSIRVRYAANDEMGYLTKKTNELLDYIEQERYQARFVEVDPLTGLKNQKGIERSVQEATRDASDNDAKIAIGFLDIDNFREVNNQYGNVEGDNCIRFVASVLEASISSGAIGRHNGDKFMFCITGFENDDFINKTFADIRRKLEDGYYNRIMNKNMSLPCSIGIIIDQGKHMSYNSLVSHASEALYQVKENGKNGCRILSENDIKGTVMGTGKKVLELLDALHKSVKNNCDGFYLCHQPLVNAADNKIIGVESLLRWNKEPFGEVSPGSFIPLLEDDSCFFKLGNWILRQALIECRPILKQNPDFIVHVNVAYSQLIKREFNNAVIEILNDVGFPPKNLCLELTERCRLLEIDYLIEEMNFFRSKGISIALDDFGTGFSSLSLLRKLPVDKIKIDRSFITNIQSSHTDQTIVKSVLQCAESLNIEVCIEGVENEDLRNFLKQYSAEVYQGYYYSKPVRIENFMKML